MMKINNFRAGFATNSSSSHSVVFIPDHMIGNISEIEPDAFDYYGWDHFRLTTQESKLRYLAAQLISGAWQNFKPNVIEAIEKELGKEIEIPPEIVVDHQSKMVVPSFDKETLNGLVKLFMSDKVVVLGGNDNTDYHNNFVEGMEQHPALSALTGDYEYRIKYDGENVIAFSCITGYMTRLNLVGGNYVKSATPELVDVKITDWCDAGCNFCYQSSTKEGKHADLSSIQEIGKMLKELKVFEVAIGGGEPTSHPEFGTILNMFERSNIIPNFTTMSSKWLSNSDLVNTVKYRVGGIGVSCTSAKGLSLVKEIRDVLNALPGRKAKVTAQHVLGSVPLWTTVDFLNSAFAEHIPVLLLGYKEVGFGKNHARFDDKGEVGLFLTTGVEKFNSNVTLSFDTALVDQHPELVGALGALEAQVSSPEGKFSCYIDAVDNLMGPSSYIEKERMDSLTFDAEVFKEKYATY